MKYNFDELIERRNTSCVKWDFINANEDDKDKILPLSIADMDFACAQPILDALKERVNKQIFGYSLADKSYFDAVTSWFKRRFDYEINPEEIVTSPGIVPALAAIVRMVTNEGEGVIIQNPVYYPFSRAIVNNGRKLLVNELINDNGYYKMDFEDLEEKAKDPNTKLFLFCSPHNPVGRVWKKEELQKVIDICVENDVYLVSDEIHCDIVRKGVKHTPVGTLSSDEKIIVALAASKTFNLAGLQMSSLLFKTEELRRKWSADLVDRNHLFGAGVFGLEGTKAAYNLGEEWLENANEYMDGNLQFIKEFLDQHLPKAKYIIPEGTYFAWIDLREYGFSAEELEDLMVNKAKLILDEGYIFGEQGRGFERINVACPRQVLEECMNRVKDVIL